MKKHSDDFFDIEIKNNIIEIIWKKDYYDFEEVDFGMKKRAEIADNNKYPILSDFRKVKSGSRKAKERLAASDGGEGVIAVAILVSSLIHKVMFNFFNSIYKAPAPTMLFTDKDKALEWLEQYKNKN